MDRVPDFVCGLAFIAVFDDLNIVTFQVFIAFEVCFEGNAPRLLNVEDEKGQASFFGDPGVDLAQGSRSTVPGIGKCLFAFLLSLGIDVLESLPRHVDFASDLNVRNRLFHLPYDIRDLPGIHGYVFAFGNSVASCNGKLQLAVLIAEGHRQAVDLGLDKELGFIAELADHCIDELIYFLFREHVLK